MRPLVCRELIDGCRARLQEVLVYVTKQEHAYKLNGHLAVHGIQVLTWHAGGFDGCGDTSRTHGHQGEGPGMRLPTDVLGSKP